MKSFLVGLLVIAVLCVLSAVGLFLVPVLFIAGFFARILLLAAFFIFMIWAVGKLTLWMVGELGKREKKSADRKSKSRKA